jgi:uncharacterized protein YndB with AHSA1/START domain
MNDSSDRIERRTVVKAPRSRVWRALSEAPQFGRWFGVNLEGKQFVAGQRISGQVTYPGYEHVVWEAWIERIEPERLLSWRWHPAAIEPAVDYSTEPMTRVVFELEEIAEGTLVSIVESGFDQVPPERRAKAFRLNTEGWDEQLLNIAAACRPA